MAKDKTKPRPDLIEKRQAAQEQQAAKKRKERRRIFVNWLIGLTIIGLCTWGLMTVINHVEDEAGTDLVNGKEADQITPPHAAIDGLSIVGQAETAPAANAPMVDLYSDFQCEGCIAKMQYFGQGLVKLAEEGRIVLRYHLSMAKDMALENTNSGRANVAAACADTVNHFLKYSQVIFEAGAGALAAGAPVAFTTDQLANDYAVASGLNGDDLKNFQQCFKQRATSTFVTAMSTANATQPMGNYETGITVTDDLFVFANGQEVDLLLAFNAEGDVNIEELLTLLTPAVDEP